MASRLVRLDFLTYSSICNQLRSLLRLASVFIDFQASALDTLDILVFFNDVPAVLAQIRFALTTIITDCQIVQLGELIILYNMYLI